MRLQYYRLTVTLLPIIFASSNLMSIFALLIMQACVYKFLSTLKGRRVKLSTLFCFPRVQYNRREKACNLLSSSNITNL